MVFLFWFFAFLLVYPLILYPLCLMLGKYFRRWQVMSCASTYATACAPTCTATYAETDMPTDMPRVSILLSVYNEEAVIQAKIENFLALEYKADRLELLIISDQSTDATESIIAQYSHDPRIRLLRQEKRGGKTQALNRAAQEARGDILFFTDADSMLHPQALAPLIQPFIQSSIQAHMQPVGLVSGRSVYKDALGQESTGSLYRRYEEWIKQYEGQLFGIVGADGAIYALRKELYTQLPTRIINDLAHPIQVVLAGQQALAQPTALVYEPAEDNEAAFARQTRIMAQSWHVFFTYARPLWKAKRWGFLWQCISHKVLRWLALLWLLGFGIATLGSISHGGIWPSLGLLALLSLLLAAALGERARSLGRICRLFLLQSAAGLYGLVRLCQGEAFVTWTPKGK